MFDFLPHPLSTIVPFVIVLGVLVFIHELGHYLAARWCGIHVEAFSIGFGKPIARWRDRLGTEWRLSILPLGGYVKLHGQERPEDVGADVQALWQPGRTFHEKGVGKRAIVIAAGPAANFLLAIVLYAALFAIAGQPVTLPVVGEVQPASAAARAGLQTGDRIAEVDGAKVATFEDLRAIVMAHPASPITVDFTRAGVAQSVVVTPDAREEGGRRIGMLGVASREVVYHRLSPGRAMVQGVARTWQVTQETLSGIGQMISGRRGTAELGGFLGIAQLSGQAAALGLATLVGFVAVLSVNLGLINLFPVPILDGGHLLFYLAEVIRGRPLPSRALEYGFRAGLALLAALFVFATWNDLSRMGVVQWVTGHFG